MTESPPSSCLIGRDEGRVSMLRESPRTRSSPRTPAHPSNGYKVVEEDGLRQKAQSSPKTSPGRLDFGPSNNAQLGVSDDSMSSSANNYLAVSAPPDVRKSLEVIQFNQPTEDSSDTQDLAIVVSQKEEIYEVLAASHEDRPASINISDIKPRRRCKSIVDGASSKTTQQRGLLLNEEALEPLTPEKMAPDNNMAYETINVTTRDFTPLATKEEGKVLFKRTFDRRRSRLHEIALGNNKACELSSATSEEITTLAMKEKDKVVSKLSSSRRHSLLIQEMTHDKKACGLRNATSEELSALAMTKEEKIVSELTSSSRCSLLVQEKVSDSSPGAVDVIGKKRQTKRRYSAKEDNCVLPSPKRMNLGMKDVSMNCTKEHGVMAERRDDNGVLPSSDESDIQEKSVTFTSSASFAIGMTEKGHLALVQALKKISFNVFFGSIVDNISKRSGARHRSRKSGRHAPRSVLALLNSGENVSFTSGDGEEFASNSSKIKARTRNRRDTFDLYKKRELTSAAKHMDLKDFIENTVVPDGGVNLDYVTPTVCNTKVDVDAKNDLDVIRSRIYRTPDDAPEVIGKDEIVTASTEQLTVMKNNLQTLTSIGIEEKMRQIFPAVMTHAYKYPCVSVRIFAAMSIVYQNQKNFAPLLPFLLSLVDAEIVSLKNKEENDGCFINKKVCFSGFDYSSTKDATGAVVGQGGGDLRPSIEALESVLQQALKLARPIHYLDIAIQCLQCMVLCGDVSNACAKTVVGYFPSARFEKALRHYLDELKDVKRYLLSQSTQVSVHHLGVRYRLNDFIGRSVRFHLRELLNTIPESVVDFNINACKERWGRAVDDRSISSILNFSLEKIHELMTSRPKIFEHGVQSMPSFFVRDASTYVHSLPRDSLKNMDKSTYESLMIDITEARSFLFGARACRFVLQLLTAKGVEKHIDTMGGWEAIEAITGTFYKLNLHKGSENEHFMQLREVRDLIFMLEGVDGRFNETVKKCELYIRKLRRKLNFNSKSSYIHSLKVLLTGEKDEYFPLVVAQ